MNIIPPDALEHPLRCADPPEPPGSKGLKRVQRESAFLPIPQTYRQAGMTMTLVRREGMAAMYADSGHTYFEVHRIRLAKACHAFGKDFPAREALACNNEFGRTAWACTTRQRADVRFGEALAASPAREANPVDCDNVK